LGKILLKAPCPEPYELALALNDEEMEKKRKEVEKYLHDPSLKDNDEDDKSKLSVYLRLVNIKHHIARCEKCMGALVQM